MKVRGVLPLVLLPLASAGAIAQLTPGERNALDDALLVAGLRRNEVAQIGRSYTIRPDAHPLVKGILASPLEGINPLLETVGDPEGGLASRLVAPARLTIPVVASPELDALPTEVGNPVRRLLGAIAACNAELRTAWGTSTPESRRSLIENVPVWWFRAAGWRPEFAKGSAPASEPLTSGIDTNRIVSAGLALNIEVERAVAALRKAKPSGFTSQRFTVDGMVVEIGDAGPSEHNTRDTALCIDLGGKNRYTGRYGAGISYASVLIDLGEAEIDAPDASIGCGILGVGIARFTGPVRGSGQGLTFGAGVLGLGLMRSEAPVDLKARIAAQGFGLAGMGLLSLGGGDDNLSLGGWGQGAATASGIGLLFDAGGNDLRRASGLVPDALLRGSECCAQGYAEASGLGVLLDEAGDDTDLASTRAQGAAVNSGVGLLFDRKGNDVRNALRLAQGAGDGGGIGVIFDAEGDDLYALGGDQGQGSGNLGGVGLAIDRAGDDTYANAGGSIGIGERQGIGIVLEGGGRDAATPRISPAIDGSISLVIALGEEIRGLALPAVGGALASGVGSSVAHPGTGGAGRPDRSPPAPGSLAPNPERITRAINLLQTRRSGLLYGAVRELTGFGKPGLDAGIAVLDTLPDAGIEALAMVADALGEPGRAAVRTTAGPNPSSRALLLAAYSGTQLPSATVAPALADDARRRAALIYLAEVGDRSLGPAVLPYVISEDRTIALLAMRAELRSGGPSETPSLQAIVTTTDPALRNLVHVYIARDPGAIDFAKTLLIDGNPQRVSAGVAILGYVGTEEALRLAGTGLNNPDREVRLATMRTLAGRVPEGWRSRVVELQRDPDPLVSGMARSLPLGR